MTGPSKYAGILAGVLLLVASAGAQYLLNPTFETNLWNWWEGFKYDFETPDESHRGLVLWEPSNAGEAAMLVSGEPGTVCLGTFTTGKIKRGFYFDVRLHNTDMGTFGQITLQVGGGADYGGQEVTGQWPEGEHDLLIKASRNYEAGTPLLISLSAREFPVDCRIQGVHIGKTPKQ